MNGSVTFQLYQKNANATGHIGAKDFNDEPLNSFVFHHQEGLYDVFDITPPDDGEFVFQIFGSHEVYSLDANYVTNLALFELDVSGVTKPGLDKKFIIVIFS